MNGKVMICVVGWTSIHCDNRVWFESAEIGHTYCSRRSGGQQHRQFLQILQVHDDNSILGWIYRDVRVLEHGLQVSRPVPLKQRFARLITRS